MFTATKDLILPTTVTGSWPRPRWYTAGSSGRPLDTALMDVGFREQFTDALATCSPTRSARGSTSSRTATTSTTRTSAGARGTATRCERWSGLEHDQLAVRGLAGQLLAYPPGTILHEIFGGLALAARGRQGRADRGTPLEYAKLWRIAQARTGKPVKFGTVSAQVFATSSTSAPTTTTATTSASSSGTWPAR